MQLALHVRRWLAQDPKRTPHGFATVAGVSHHTIRYVLGSGPERQVYRATAERILRVRLSVAPVNNCSVSGAVTRRMVEALRALGWPVSMIAEAAGVSHATLVTANLLTGCWPSTQAAVQRVFDQWRLRLGPSNPVRIRAAKDGCLPWVAWDGRIQDRFAEPDLSDLSPQVRAAWDARTNKPVDRRQPVLAAAAANRPVAA